MLKELKVKSFLEQQSLPKKPISTHSFLKTEKKKPLPQKPPQPQPIAPVAEEKVDPVDPANRQSASTLHMSFNGLNTPGFKEAQEEADDDYQKVIILSKNNATVTVEGESLSASMSEEMIPSGIEQRKSRTPSRAHMRRHKEPILQRDVTQGDRYL